jgi:hypothetical protein
VDVRGRQNVRQGQEKVEQIKDRKGAGQLMPKTIYAEKGNGKGGKKVTKKKLGM